MLRTGYEFFAFGPRNHGFATDGLIAMSIPRFTERFHATETALRAKGQSHLFRWWAELTEDQRERLLFEIDTLPWGLLDGLIRTHVLSRPTFPPPRDIEAAPVLRRRPGPAQDSLYRIAEERGHRLLKEGRVAAFTVAGGQGSRLGFEGPKGLFPVTPVKGKTLFQLFAETVLAARKKWKADIPWYIMTSPANHEDTVAYFERNDWFGLPAGDVMFFSQGVLPAIGFDGKLLLESKCSLALAPDGHGGSLKALFVSGALADMRHRGVEVVSYFQIDNPMVMPFDPLFIGLHVETGSEMATKVTPKAHDLERVGNVCMVDGKVTVIEYSELPESLALARNPDGSRRLDAANLAVHLLDVSLIERLTSGEFQLPFRRAEKAVPHVDESGITVKPPSPNAVKLESFIFDVLPLARNPLVFEVDRAEEFSPVKNATGADSPETSRRDQVARAARWIEAAGIEVPRDSDGAPATAIEIPPRLALSHRDLVERASHLPTIDWSGPVYLE